MEKGPDGPPYPEDRAWERRKIQRVLEELEILIAYDLGSALHTLRALCSIFAEDYAEVLDEEGIRYLKMMERSAERTRRFRSEAVHLMGRARRWLAALEAGEGALYSDPDKTLLLRTPVSQGVALETVRIRHEGLYATYLHRGGRRIGPIGYYSDELHARAGHLCWVRFNWWDPLPGPLPRRPRLLLVEDNPDDARVARLAFERSEGKSPAWEVEEVSDGQAALDRLGLFESSRKPTEPVDLVLMNLAMPKMHGHEVLEHIRASPKTAGLPVVIWTVSMRREDIERAERLRADGYLSKEPAVSVEAENLRCIKRYWERALYEQGKLDPPIR